MGRNGSVHCFISDKALAQNVDLCVCGSELNMLVRFFWQALCIHLVNMNETMFYVIRW